ncbi:MAG: ATP-binding cassette domain-containing protein [Ignavibacteriae bacterium]|nr:ATP-binding cassette domain-containing protein [Ignavibacteriota bacterium]
MLTVSHLRKQFSNVLAVDDVSFSVRSGQVFGLIGPNGAGKSTTIRMIMDIIKPDSGDVRFEGIPDGNARRNAVGYLPEERGLYRKNKLIDVITYFASLRGMDARAARDAAMPWLERFSLLPYLRRNVEELSKGNQQKVQFLIAELHRPRLLVLDEVFSGLDPVNQIIIRDALQELRNDKRAIIFSTHQMEFAEKLCDDLVLINRGNVVLSGSPQAIKQRFGRNSVQIEFQGDGDFLRSLHGVTHARVDQNFAELVLDEGAHSDALLTEAASRLSISRFERIAPSLEAVFIDTVGMPAATPADETPSPSTTKAMSADTRVRKAFFSMVLMFLMTAYMTATTVRAADPEWIFPIGFAAVALLVLYRYIRTRRRVADERRAGANGGQRA